MNFSIQKILANWKTSLQPLLSIIMVAAPFATIEGSPIHNTTVLWSIATISAVAKVGIGLMQQDAGVTPAHTPDDGVKFVESHEVPNDPKAIPVKEV